ncbi:hypothetical protein Dsin_015980 [Dipteronia sinensis]|uniref:Uncharacterized protein n=1 Tax=Dipteronia sinensis TaxID=43782 RepID=A0AAE0ACJ6_9ROSI|nr:hypothetical protein Dsin_015980 [Dipteronia sinensis]
MMTSSWRRRRRRPAKEDDRDGDQLKKTTATSTSCRRRRRAEEEADQIDSGERELIGAGGELKKKTRSGKRDFKEGDLVSLAFGLETFFQSLVFKAIIQLGISSNNMSTTTTTTNHHSAFPHMSPRVSNNGGFEQNLSFSDPKASPFLSYDNIRYGLCLVPGISHLNNGGGGDIGSNSRNNFGVGCGDFVDEFQFNDYLSFLNETSKNEKFKL